MIIQNLNKSNLLNYEFKRGEMSLIKNKYFTSITIIKYKTIITFYLKKTLLYSN